MAATLYALLVGIDDYRPPVPSLRGCVNDIKAIRSLLETQAADKSMTLNLRVLLNEESTRDAIIDGFVAHLARAKEGDVALFYYSGHGSQERTPEELLDLEPDGMDETLVCFDSREPGRYDLADKEIASLLRYVARRNAHVVVVLDCCHSGSATRAISPGTAFVRRAPTFSGLRPLSSLYLAPGDEDKRSLSSTWRQLPGRHIALSACRDDQEAQETVGAVPQRGAFSFYLTEALTNSLKNASYRDVFNQVSARVQAMAFRQSPVLEAVVNADIERPFLGGVLQPQQSYFTLHFEQQRGWVMDGGTVNGIPAVAGDETTILAVFDGDAVLAPGEGAGGTIGSARVTETSAVTSVVEITLDEQSAEKEKTYKAVIVGLPMPPLGVRMQGCSASLALVRNALAKSGPNGTPSLLVAESDDKFQMVLAAGQDGYALTRAGSDEALSVNVSSATETGAAQAVERMEHVARWIRVLELDNPCGRLPAGSLVLDMYRIQKDGTEVLIGPGEGCAAPVLEYSRSGEEMIPARVKVMLRNRSKRRLFCGLLDLQDTFGIASLLPGGTLVLEPGAEAAAVVNGDTTFEAAISDEMIQAGIVQLRDTMKVIASTEPWDPSRMEMSDLDVRDRARKDVAPNVTDTLSRLLIRVNTRMFRPLQPQDTLADWTTAQISATIVRPREGVQVPEAGQTAALSNGVVLLGHPGLKATARLSTEGIASRAVNRAVPPTPAWLVDSALVVRPFQFPGSRSDSEALSVLELQDVTDAGSVTPEAPLVLRSAEPMGPDEFLLPYAFDGEFHLPLGFAEQANGGTEIHIERLPEPNARTLTGSLTIYFKKVVSGYLGTQYPYPLLSVVSKGAPGKTVYNTDRETVAARVSAAERILLYIHGIIGDTQGMTASAFEPLGSADATPLAGDVYDLILAFDYENLNTPIENTARDLKQRLADVGLGEGHGKQLHLAAHSMGGLVARWFIEREGGNSIVQHLTMLGTPNGGSPWSSYERWFTTLLTYGLNGLSKVAWPPTVLGGLMRAISWTGKTVADQHAKIEVALAEMGTESDFLAKLAASNDPGISYAIIAGNTSLILPAHADPEQSALGRLLQRVSPTDLLYRTAMLAFFHLPNDVAVSVSAIRDVPAARAKGPVFNEVDCDHMTYFTNPSSLSLIRAAAFGDKQPVEA